MFTGHRKRLTRPYRIHHANKWSLSMALRFPRRDVELDTKCHRNGCHRDLFLEKSRRSVICTFSHSSSEGYCLGTGSVLRSRKNRTCILLVLPSSRYWFWWARLIWLTAAYGVKWGPGVCPRVWQSRSGFERWCIFDVDWIHAVARVQRGQVLWINGMWLINKRQTTFSPPQSLLWRGMQRAENWANEAVWGMYCID